MDNRDLANLVVVSNEAAMQWYSLITQKAQPSQPDVLVTPLPGGGMLSVGPQTGTLIVIGLVVLVAIVMLSD